jgi:hypothetical protein
LSILAIILPNHTTGWNLLGGSPKIKSNALKLN